ncbi:MAG TPA: glycosyltransferase family 4 protein [Gemmatimonadaceae bacterium]|nr:glycosyltransferase family 4 protein [Gemmatimonadaceae bacterium]
MSLTVLSVAYSLATVGTSTVGGAEQVLAALDLALCREGQRSIVVACADSAVHGELVATPCVGASNFDAVTRARALEAHRHAIADALARWPVDVVHMHGMDFYEYLPPPGVPVLVTLHLPPSWYTEGVLRSTRPGTYFHCVSCAQRRSCPADAPLLPTIENGVPLGAAPRVRAARPYVIALGRICPEKGYHHALDAARHAGVPMLLAGYTYPFETHRRYFDEQIVPRLDAHRRFVGPARFHRKRQLLAGARCLLVPSLAPETSSLVAMEALACGTPVVAFSAGALPEIVEHGVTGFLVRDVREMADAIAAVGDLDPAACRHAAETRFSADVMTRRYLERYRALAGGAAVT